MHPSGRAPEQRGPDDAGPPSGRAAAFFDLDKTLISRTSTLAFGRSFHRGGLVGNGAVLRSLWAQAVVGLVGADADRMERMRTYLAELCRGWPVEQVQAIVDETLHDLITPLVYAEGVALVAEHRLAGRPVVVVSSSGEEVVVPIAEMLGADHVAATRMQVSEGRYTGHIERYVYGPGKADAVRELAERHGWDLAASWAYSDSMTDLPMLEAVGRPVAVNPDRALRRTANDRGWQVLDFDRPYPLVRLPPPPPRRTVLAGAVVASVAGAAGLAAVVAARRPSLAVRAS